MANTKSAEKRHRQNLKNRQRNRQQRSRMRSAVRNLRAVIDEGDASQARELLQGTLSLIDVTAQKGVIHSNTAARYKSRLTRAVQRIAS